METQSVWAVVEQLKPLPLGKRSQVFLPRHVGDCPRGLATDGMLTVDSEREGVGSGLILPVGYRDVSALMMDD